MTKEGTENLLLVVVDDDSLYREYVSHLLSRAGAIRVMEAGDGATLLDILDGNAIDCIVLDYNLGTETGLSIGELVNKKYFDPPPIVMLTGEGGERTAVKAFRGGFSDYISKRNFNPDELIAAIRGAVNRRAEARAESEDRERLTRLSGLDGATGLHARHFMLERLADLVSSAGRRAAPFALIEIRMAGLDGVRDQFGQAMGDRALRAFALRLQKSTRKDDLVGRYGRDTFLYLIDHDPRSGTVLQICEHLARELTFDANFEQISVRLSANLGMASFPADGADPESLLEAAEQALRRAEANGVPFDPAANQGPTAVDAVASIAGSSDKGSDDGQVPERPADRRGERRQRVLKRGQILARGLTSAIDCTIRDINSKGARLRVDDYFAAPERFELRLVGTGTNRPVKVRWQVGNDIGVEFL